MPGNYTSLCVGVCLSAPSVCAFDIKCVLVFLLIVSVTSYILTSLICLSHC